ncbi:MAG: thiamine pyrophosphate-dependent enzyme, partial [Brachymonas sp.]|nr:thiamine pyrophosphate-dependent enzyme [Brachymonas sp.]
YRIATSGFPGPVLVEIPVNLQLFAVDVPAPPLLLQPAPTPAPDLNLIAQAADALLGARQCGLFVGWGARQAQAELVQIAEMLQAPVCTTMQGLAVFPADHPLHTGFGCSRSAVPASRHAFKQCDALLAVGTRFAEIPTGSFAMQVPENLVHIDIDPQVFNANYPARVAIAGDAQAVLAALLQELQKRNAAHPVNTTLQQQIARDKAAYQQEWFMHDSADRVNPARFFNALREAMPANSITVLDDGNHTFLTAELYPQVQGASLITPTDYNAMGYAVPAAIGAKLAAPEREVAAIVGDGCFAMTCMEIMTATANQLGVLFCVFKDGALSQIAQAQQRPYQRQTCTVMPHSIDLQGVAQATGAAYVAVANNATIAEALAQARAMAARGQPVIVDVAIDYSKPTAFTLGTSASNFKTFPLMQKWRFIKRMLARKWGA